MPSSGFKLLNSDDKIDEEKLPWYSKDLYYPVRIGEVFRSRYQTLGKLGYGTRSTVWLGRGLHAHRYVALKVCERNEPAQRELEVYSHLDSIATTHAGAHLTRELYDSFSIKTIGGDHLCLVHEPLGMSLKSLVELFPDECMPEEILRPFVKCLLLALDCLHTVSKTVHTDLQSSNILIRSRDDEIFRAFEAAERTDPSPRKIDGDRIIYQTRKLDRPKKVGFPVLCDFGEARYWQVTYTDDVQPYQYRAPEVILDIPWSYEIDIWNVGVLIWSLFEGRNLFTGLGPAGEQSNRSHLAEIQAVLGQPPIEFLRRSAASWGYYDADDMWKDSHLIHDTTLESSETRLEGENKAIFLSFVRRMLCWLPEERATAKQLLGDPWLKEP
ncbi:hypothetical protein LTR95_013258 [Oleoguttula sp. CCFEE 5521]